MTVTAHGKSHDSSVCGATKRSGGACRRPAGWGTAHPGTGRCKLHGGNAGRPLETGKYSRWNVIKSRDAEAYREHFELDPDPLNLLADVLEMRVRVADFCNRYDDFTEALIAWHASFNQGAQEAQSLYHLAHDNWRSKYAEWQEALAAYRAEVEKVQTHYKQGWPEPPELVEFPEPPQPPDPVDFEGKPRRVHDILSATRIIAEIGALVERIRRSDMERGLSLVDVNAILKRHAEELMAAANETIHDDEQRDALLDAVTARWDAVPLAVDRTKYHGDKRP